MTLWILTLSVIFTVTVLLCHTDEFYCLLLLPCYGETNIDVYRAFNQYQSLRFIVTNNPKVPKNGKYLENIVINFNTCRTKLSQEDT